MKPRAIVVVLTVPLLALLVSLAGIIQRQKREIATLKVLAMKHDRGIKALSDFAVSKAYMDQVLPGHGRMGTIAYRPEGSIVPVIHDVYLADIALTEDLPAQTEYELIASAYAAYDYVRWYSTVKRREPPLPEIDWSSMESLEEGFKPIRGLRFRPGLWLGRGGGVDAVSYASYPFPRIKKWDTEAEFRADFDSYRRKMEERASWTKKRLERTNKR